MRINNFPRRRSVRLEGYDYSQPGAYFITIITLRRACLLGTISNGQVSLTSIGKLVESEWQRLERRFNHVELGAWIVMPNHIHGIISINQDGKRLPNEQYLEQFSSPVGGSIPTIIRSFKSSVTQQVQNLIRKDSAPVWQRGYYDHIIRSESDLKNIHEYILDNPRKWAEDENYSQ